jgi:hypothetical protein
MIFSGMVLSPAFLERLMVWRLKSYTGDKPCSTTSTSTSKFAQETGRYRVKWQNKTHILPFNPVWVVLVRALVLLP